MAMDTGGHFAAAICLILLTSEGLVSCSPAAERGGFCPERCDCQHAQHLLCTNRGLRAVPKVASRVPEDVLVFSLGGNFICNISAFDFTRYSNLIRLNLQYNQIQTIHPKALEKLSNLEELYLGHNLLSTVHPGTLQSLKKLTILYSNNNDLKKITPELFSNLDSLVKLRLDGNGIELLQDSVFKSLTNLHYLHLESNQLQHIHRNAFSKLNNLRFLNLAHNKQSAVRNAFTFSQLRALTTLLLSENEITHVGNQVFQNLKKLSKLSLSNNKISILHSGALKGLSSLREFFIDGNELAEIPAGLLDPLERIEELDFSRNRISNVDSLAFAQLNHLRTLKLKDNRLTSLSGDIFALNNVLYDLDLHGNNWTCDCRLGELKRWMTSAHSQGKLLTVFVQCHHPATLRGKYLDYVNSSQLLPLGNWTSLCSESRAGPEESRGGGILEKEVVEDRGRRAGEGETPQEATTGRNDEGEDQGNTEEESRSEDIVGLNKSSVGNGVVGGVGGEVEKRKREGEEDTGIQGDQGGPGVREAAEASEATEATEASASSVERKRQKKKPAGPRSRPGRRRSQHPVSSPAPPPAFPALTRQDEGVRDTTAATEQLSTPLPVRSGETFDLLVAAARDEETLPVITDPCVFNRHFIANVSVDQVTSNTVTVHWSTAGHRRHAPGPGRPGRRDDGEVHYRVLFDRFGTPDRFPRYVYAAGAARSVTLRELAADVTYMVCVEGVVAGSVCQVAPRDHCAGLVTLPEAGVWRSSIGRGGGGGGGGLTSDLQLVTVATLAGNAVLLLVIGAVWLGRSLRRRLQRRKSAVHVRHMYSTRRRPFRPAMAAATAAALSADFTSYQSSRPPRLVGPLDEGDLIEFPCDRFLDNSTARRDADMQRFND